jgi:Glycosyl transferases group 1
MPEPLRARVVRHPAVRGAWTTVRRRQLLEEYRSRRDGYRDRAAALGVAYDHSAVEARTAARLRARGVTPVRRRLGEVHTFAFVPRISWHAALYPDLHQLGPVSVYDYAAHGYTWAEFYAGDTVRRAAMNAAFVTAARTAHAERPLDWIFIYASGVEVLASALQELRETIGVPIVTMCLDDKQSWTGALHGGQRHGMIDLVPLIDLAWTSAMVATDWYLVEGGNPVYLPEGFDPATYRPMDLPQDIPVSFIGAAYGFRPALVRDLQRAGIPVQAFGDGWGTRSVWGDEQIAVINRSVINLGHGGIGYADDLLNVKTRDFEIPGTGGGMYLTTYNPDLARHYDIGRDIACFRSLDDLIEQLRYFLANPAHGRAMAEAARRRCLAEHRWQHRYEAVLRLCGVLSAQ